MRARALVAVAAVVGSLALPAAARAHAVLTHSTPHADSTVQQAPDQVVLDFNEPVGAGPGSVRVYDESGQRVDHGAIVRPRQQSAGIRLRHDLPRGVYTATYRVISADGHPVSGGVTFGVRAAVRTTRSGPSVAQLLAEQQPGTAVEIAYGIARGLQYLAALVLIGSLAFRLFAWRAGSAAGRWPAGLLRLTAAVGLLSAGAGLLLQGLLAQGTDLGDVFRSGVVSASLESDSGTAWLARALAWLFAAVVAWPPAPWRREQLAWLTLPAAVIVGSYPYGGHASTQTPAAVLVPADVIHLLAAGAWLGGLVLLLAAFWPRGTRVDPEPAWLATAAFSRTAIWAIAAVVAAGTAQAWFYLGSVRAFVDGSYGIALLPKIALLGAIAAIGALNRRHLVARGDRSARALRRAMHAEIAIAVGILAATAVLVRATPPKAIAQGPQQKELDLGPMRLELVVEPATVGRNAFHFYLFDQRTGAQISRLRELRLTISEPKAGIAPITVQVPRKGPAHYELLDQAVPATGRWTTTITARVSEFDQYAVKTTLKFRAR